MTADLDARAEAIMRGNDRGGFTVPTARLYPFQWNWDSAFAALGFAAFDMGRAWRELETLVSGAWPNGMIPHIVFRRDDPDYFPGPDVWGCAVDPPSSGHSQPPVAASMAWRLLQADAGGAERARALLPGLAAYGRWWRERRATPEGLAVCTHPWESGRDNSPDWDGALAAVDGSGVAPFTRRDTGHVDPAMRPTQAEYERYIALVEHGRGVGWDHARITAAGPFRVADPGLTFMAVRADRDLAAMARALGAPAVAAEADARAESAAAAAAALWCGELGVYAARDLITGAWAPGASSVGFLSFWAGVGEPLRDAALLATYDRIAKSCAYGLPSYDPVAPEFDSRRYWRGPVWAPVNWLLAQGLAEAGHAARAQALRAATRALIERAGFCEYFDPHTGEGLGGGEFTWTAAVWLAWAREG